MLFFKSTITFPFDRLRANRKASGCILRSVNQAGKLSLLLLPLLFTLLFPKELTALSPGEEEELSREFLHMALKTYKPIDDPLIVNYVNKVGKRILDTIPGKPFAYRFYVIQQDEYNAFAGPAGNIFINSGLLMDLENEEELAGILAHEIAHVSCRHISDMIKKSQKATLATLAGLAAGIFLGVGGAPAVGTAVTTGAVAAGQSMTLAYSRDNEMQADQIALKYLPEAGYGCEGLLTSLQKIRSKSWYGSDQIPTYLMTHPAVEDRIAYIGSWVETHPEQKLQAAASSADTFHLVQTRLIALYSEESAAQKRFAAILEKTPDDVMASYGYGLVLTRTGNRKEAIVRFKNALEKKPFEPIIIRDLGMANFLDGQYEAALKMLTSAIHLQPDDPDCLLYLGRTQKELGKLADAADTFETIVVKYPGYNQAYYYLGEAYGAMERFGEAHFFLGVYDHTRKNYRNAAFHFKKALETLTDPAIIREAETLLKDSTHALGERAPQKDPLGRGNSEG